MALAREREKRRSHPIGGAYLRQERIVRYRFIDAEKASYPLGLLCRVTRVSRSAYHDYQSGNSYVVNATKAALGERVTAVFYRHRRRYGSRRIVAEIKAEGESVGRFGVRSQMKRLGLRAIQPRSFVPQTTDSRHTAQISPNLLLDEQNVAQQPREVVVGDITYLPLRSGKWGYLASWQDKFTKRIVGWAVEARMTEALVIKAFEKAVAAGGVTAKTIVHTDRGSQYVSANFRALLADYGCRQSMSRRGNCWDRRTSRKFVFQIQSRVAGRRDVRERRASQKRDVQLR